MNESSFTLPTTVATCPTCGSALLINIEAWETDTGIPLHNHIYMECAANEAAWDAYVRDTTHLMVQPQLHTFPDEIVVHVRMWVHAQTRVES